MTDKPRNREQNRRHSQRRRANKQARRQFIAIDSEGGRIGGPYFSMDSGQAKEVQPHKSFLWGAGDINGNVEWLYSSKPLKSIEMIEFVLAQKRREPEAIFVSFAFGYDVMQLLDDLPYEQAWELQHGKRFKDKDNKKAKADSMMIVPWKDYRFQYLKGKWLSIWRWHADKKKREYIKIFDTFGFFQHSFVNAIKETPGIVNEAELAKIIAGKDKRGDFDHSDLENTQEYTRLELAKLCLMMQKYRETFEARNLHLGAWCGAGSIASAMMKREHIGPAILGSPTASDLSEPQEWANCAFAGGRIELIKQGVSHERLWTHDVSSAYPAEQAPLSSMEGGTWIKGCYKPGDIRSIDRLSIVRLRAEFLPGLPFYPLFYRTPRGQIFFPQKVYGTYMQVEAVAAFDFAAQFGGEIEIEGVWEFRPASCIKPFDYILKEFEYRAGLPKGDLAGIVIKKGMCSNYGKLAQAVGTVGKPPTFAGPWHSAAITAGTRANMLRAAMLDPTAVVMFATDGIVSERPLPLEIPIRKTLGLWEAEEKPLGGVFLHSGIYCFFGETASKTRGFRPDDVDPSMNSGQGMSPDARKDMIAKIILETIPAAWKKGQESFSFPIKLYATLGLSTASREAWDRRGSWINARRELNLNSAGSKRVLMANAAERRSRARHLVTTIPNSIHPSFCVDGDGEQRLSYPRVPDWLDVDLGEEIDDDREQFEISGGFLPY